MTTQGHIIVGTAGHIDHGKTSLVKVLTGVDTDRLKEEKERGITIELGFAPLTLPSGLLLGLVDVPGHERFVKNMVAGATGMDLVLLVIAADESVMPQTREHLEICQLLGVREGVVVLTKTDMVDQEWVEMVSEEVRDYLAGTFLQEAPIVPFSSLTGEGRDDVLTALGKAAERVPDRSGGGIFRLPVDRVFTMKGFGTVATGTMISGSVSTGEEVVFLPGEKAARVRGLQVHGELVQAGHAGTRTALNLQGVGKEEIHRGQTAARPGSLIPSLMLDVRLSLLPSAPRPLKNRDRVRLHLYTDEIMTRVAILEGEKLEPGANGLVQLRLEKKTVALPGDRFVIRSYSPITTIGGGEILDPFPRKHRRFRKPVLEHLSRLESGTAVLKIREFLDEAGEFGLPAGQLGVRTGLGYGPVEELLDEMAGAGEVVASRGGEGLLAYSRTAFDRIRERLIRALEKYHGANPAKAGIGREELRMRVAKELPDRPYRNLLDTMKEQGDILLDGDTVRLGGHEASLTPQQENLAAKVLNVLRPKGLSAPFLTELAEELRSSTGELKTVLNLMAERGDLVRVKDDFFITSTACRSLKEGVHRFFEDKRELSLAEFREITDTTRKWMIPLLEYLDRTQVTMRKGDVRIMRGQGTSGD
jgi:selenocysteine-specific elongation factor